MATATTTPENGHDGGDDKESSVNLAPWKSRWEDRRIGFHLKDVNPMLKKYIGQVLLDTNDNDDKSCPAPTNDDEKDDSKDKPIPTTQKRRVFVPLCGKTVDMAYLLSDHSTYVVGVEGIHMALEEFATEHPTLDIKKKKVLDEQQQQQQDTTTADTDEFQQKQDGFQRYVGNNITLLNGDYFELDETVTDGQFDVIFDRASLVAIDPKLRSDYVDIQGKLLKPGGKILLMVLERRGTEEGMKKGPPFTVPDSVVQDLYGTKDWCTKITMLEQSDQLQRKPEDKERYPDLDQLLETVYLIETKDVTHDMEHPSKKQKTT